MSQPIPKNLGGKSVAVVPRNLPLCRPVCPAVMLARMRYTLLALLCLAALIAYVQRSALSVPAQHIAHELRIDLAADMGLVQSAWYFGYAVMQLPSGWLADRIGPRLSLVLFAVQWSLMTIITSLVQDYASLLIAWTLMGAAQAGIFPCSAKAIGQSFPDLERARASGLLACGMAVGGAVGPLLTGQLLSANPWPHELDWRTCLVVYGWAGLVWSGLFLATMGDATFTNREASLPPTQPIDWRRMLTSVPLALLCAQQFLRAAAMVFFLTWFPTYLQKARGVSIQDSGWLTAIAGAGGIVGSLLGGFASDLLLQYTGNRRLSRQGIAVVGMASCALLIVASFLVQDVRLAVTLIGLGAFCATFGGVSGYTVAIEFGGKRVGTVFSTMNMCGNFGAMLFPVTAGKLVAQHGSWNFALLLFAVIMAIDAVCWSLLNPRGPLFGDEEQAARPKGT